MTAAQRRYYLSLWFRVCDARGWDRRDDARRHAEVAAALGRPKSFREFTNHDLDRVLARFGSLAGLGDRRSAIGDAATAGERRRLIHVITALRESLGHRYADIILRHRFDVVFLEELNHCEMETLRQIRFTLHARLHRRATANKETTNAREPITADR